MKKLILLFCAVSAPVLVSCSEQDDQFVCEADDSSSDVYDPFVSEYATFNDFITTNSDATVSTNKSLPSDDDEYTEGQRYYGSDFHDCGLAYINGVAYNTVMAGNFRWITGFYESSIDGNGVDWDGEDSVIVTKNLNGADVYYYPYSFAKTFKSVKAKKNKYLPVGFEELSDWKIPTLDEWEDLCLMVAYGKKTEQRRAHLVDWLELPFASACIYDPEHGNPIVFPDISAFFLEYENVTPTYTYCDLGYVADKNVPRYIFGFINTNASPSFRAPIKLFQRVKPIFYQADSLVNIAKEY